MGTYSKEILRAFVIDLTTRAGLSRSEAPILADSLIEADLRGIRTHGLLRLPIYIRRMEAGVIAVKETIQVSGERGAIKVLDAKNGLGQVACVRGMEEALSKAEQFGLGSCTVFNSNHCGVLGYYSELAAARGMIGFSATNVFPLMAPTGGKEKVLGNNPLALSVPRLKADPITYDVATSTVSYGKILTYQRRGEKIPLGWVLDVLGQPTDNPEAAISGQGSLTPFAGHKGYGLAFMLEILAGVLTGAAFGPQIHSLYDVRQFAGLGHFLMAMNIGYFMDPEMFFQRLERWIEMVKFSEPAAGSEEILIPGELEHRNRKRNLEEGLTYDESLLEEINLLADHYTCSRLST